MIATTSRRSITVGESIHRDDTAALEIQVDCFGRRLTWAMSDLPDTHQIDLIDSSGLLFGTPLDQVAVMKP